MSGKAVIVIMYGLAAIAGMLILTRKAKAAPPEIPAAKAPTIEDIMGAESVAKLNAYYNLIGELLIIGKISSTKYFELYYAYHDRWYELIGVTG